MANCPKCGEYLQLKAFVPPEQKLTMKFTLNEGLVGAQTIGKAIVAMADALKATAKSVNEKVEVFMSDCRFVEKEIEIDFIVVAMPPQANQPKKLAKATP